MAMLRDRELPPFGTSTLACNIAWILKKGFRFKIPQLVVSIKAYILRDSGVAIIAQDPSGEIDGFLDLPATEHYGDALATGSVLALKNVCASHFTTT